jgi:hypothetical protein
MIGGGAGLGSYVIVAGETPHDELRNLLQGGILRSNMRYNLLKISIQPMHNCIAVKCDHLNKASATKTDFLAPLSYRNVAYWDV